MDTKEAVATVSEPEAPSPTPSVQVPDECMIHVRFFPNGTVAEISERPPEVEPHDWYKFLCKNTQNRFQALSGGRGLFRIPRADIETLKAACVAGTTS
ncbi:hypothetical protein [Methylocaldum szegediense]|uniref:Uncharacterized protein n=1 Tax=Methylocaldum szegediense TaxID=73780 RepID=A0ABM9I8R5_9GAMM|nr:hypothetical protein [Methylocaldum szegediense]CAI8962941.1 conserved protein of unknown function [Methylocaldum szegediense]